MKNEERPSESREVKVKDPARQSWYNVKRLAQGLLRHPENVNRGAQQIISIADSNLKSRLKVTDSEN